MDESAVSTPSSSNASLSNKRRKSIVWSHFTIQQVELNGAKINKAICNYCKKHYSCSSGGGTGHLNRHWKKCLPRHHGIMNPNDPNIHYSPTPLTIEGSVIRPIPVQLPTPAKSTPGPSRLVSDAGPVDPGFMYDQGRMREGLAVYVSAAEQPFTFGQDRRFEYFMRNYCQPGFSKVPKRVVKNDALEIFKMQKQGLISEFANHNGVISFTSDMWTSSNYKLGYLSLTAHYISSDTWFLNKKIIGFRMLEYPHSDQHMYQSILNILNEYGIVDKCFSITFDNYSANSSATDFFKHNFHPPYEGLLFHIRCLCHTINLIVQDGIKLIDEDSEKNYIEKIRDSLIFIISSPSRLQEFDDLCKMNDLKPRRFKMDTPTRWNSTYLMLKSCQGYELLIKEFNSKYNHVFLVDRDFECAFTFMQLLEVFYDAIKILADVYYPTSSIALNQLYNISNTFVECRRYSTYATIFAKMEQRFKTYCEHIPPIFLLSSVMDPRKKLLGTEALIEGISEKLNIHLHNTSDSIKSMLSTLYNSYEQSHGNPSHGSAMAASPHTIRKNDASWNLIASKGKQKSTSSSALAHTDLYKYLDTEFTDFITDQEDEANFDLLSWWRKYCGNFPILSIMARDLLTPPVSTVASGVAFSASGSVLDEKKTKLSAEMLDAQVCLKDWDDAKFRDQNFMDEESSDSDAVGAPPGY
ncbi:zinc finger BED domain-containing protein RICESLEEPER 2-like [Papaver somniferum]|uniref:zinc finger BED domain-containing protein RICESLEEPER 2-like n=1 Tax=Papaver somniferum TaxID=3469 RepID=UPI000E6FA336|nr:zinc finger BED domain-containing protein RICESLEEPER 2-like [Papaver somniferum]